MKRIIYAALAFFAITAQAQVPAECAITYRNDNAWQGQLTARVGAIPANFNYTWLMGVGVVVPAGPVASAKLVVPTLGSGFGVAGSGTFYLTILAQDGATNTCAGYGPGFPLLAKPKRDTVSTVLASKITSPLVTGDLVFPLNDKALAILRANAGDPDGVVFGVSMLVPRITVYPPGEDPKKQNQPGGFSFERMSACRGTASPYCPSLVIQ